MIHTFDVFSDHDRKAKLAEFFSCELNINLKNVRSHVLTGTHTEFKGMMYIPYFRFQLPSLAIFIFIYL